MVHKLYAIRILTDPQSTISNVASQSIGSPRIIPYILTLAVDEQDIMSIYYRFGIEYPVQDSGKQIQRSRILSLSVSPARQSFSVHGLCVSTHIRDQWCSGRTSGMRRGIDRLHWTRTDCCSMKAY